MIRQQKHILSVTEKEKSDFHAALRLAAKQRTINVVLSTFVIMTGKINTL